MISLPSNSLYTLYRPVLSSANTIDKHYNLILLLGGGLAAAYIRQREGREGGIMWRHWHGNFVTSHHQPRIKDYLLYRHIFKEPVFSYYAGRHVSHDGQCLEYKVKFNSPRGKQV